jgi:hypothetical protein
MKVIFTPIPGNLIIRARLEPDGLSINGKLHSWDAAPEVVEYGEEGGLQELVSLQSDHTYQVIPSTWVDPTPPPKPDPEAEAHAALEAWRAGKSAKKWQLRTIIGPERWAIAQAVAADPSGTLGFEVPPITAWGMKVVIEDVDDVPRLSGTVDLLAYLFGMSDEEADEVFRQAAELRA